jgi:hypothetical protein
VISGVACVQNPLLDLLPVSTMQPVCHAAQSARVAICAKDLGAIAQSKAGVHHNAWAIVGREIIEVHNGRASEASHDLTAWCLQSTGY